MNKTFKRIILCITVACLASTATAQRRKTATKKPAVPVMELVQQALREYDFERADELLTRELNARKKNKQPTTDIEALLHTAWQGRSKLHATERVAVIDSFVCDKEDVMHIIRISRDNGRIDTYASTYHTTDTLGATIFENEFGNKRYLAVPDAGNGGQLRLAVTDKIGEQWTQPAMLQGLNDDIRQNFPFLLSDGLTLYYAAEGPESLGGFDIFVTRADGEDGSFLAPENVGFPFNSIANDYLMAIDEFNQLGWFVSDRGQAPGKACVYTFIPSQTREVYGDEISENQLRNIARLNKIEDTWKATDATTINAARQRLAELKGNSRANKDTQEEFNFVIDNNRSYKSLEDFHSTAARTKMQQWLTLNKDYQTDYIMLQRLRDNYVQATQQQRQQLRPTIIKLEGAIETGAARLKQLAKEIRNEEISAK